MKLQVLGPVGARDGETQIALGGPRQRAVLAVLVAFANEPVSSDRLIDEVWGAEPPAAARNSLQSMVSNLRKAVKPDPRITIDGEGRGYVLRAPVDAVDSLEFAAMVDEARGFIDSDVDAGVRLLRGALELWRGAPFGELADEIDVLRAEATRLEELRMRALEYRIEGELTTGDPGDSVGELESLIEVHPLREGLSRLLMVALARSGRQAEALRVASALRQRLAAEIGIEPSPELVRLEQEVLDQTVEAPVATVTANPYRGLESFTEADASRFFGREDLTERLLARLAEEVDGCRLLAVVGASGSGKSSVVRAGLVPALRNGAVDGSQGWVVVQMVPGVTPLRDLETALLRLAVNPPPTLLEQLARDELGLRDAVNRILPDDGSEVLLVVDQFEELFTIADPEEASLFIDVLVGAVTVAASRVRVVITLRADFYDRPLDHPGLAPLLARRTETVVAMTADELSQAIVGPAELAGVSVEPGLVAALVADATGQPGVLPMVQYALTELFEGLQSDAMTLAGYHELGGVRGAIRSRAETLYDTLDKGQKKSVRDVLLQLVTLGEGEEDTRRRVARDDVTGDNGAIEAFAAARLLSLDQDPATDRPTVEVAHEALLREWPRFSRWIDENRDDIRTHRRLQEATKDWIENERAPSYLLTGERLSTFTLWRKTTDQTLAPAETELLKVSQSAVEAERHRRATTRRRVLATLATATVISVALAVVALVRTGQATEQTRIAEVRELAGSAIANLDTDPELSLLLALEAVEREPLPEAQEALHQAIAAQRVLMTIPATGGAAVYLDESTVAALNEDGTITIYDIASGQPQLTRNIGTPGWLETQRSGRPAAKLVAVNRGSVLAVGTTDGSVVVLDVATGAEMWRRKIGVMSPQIAATLDGSAIAARAWVDLDLEEKAGDVFDGLTGAQRFLLPDPFSLPDVRALGTVGLAITRNLPASQATLILDYSAVHFASLLGPIDEQELPRSFSEYGGDRLAAGSTKYLGLHRDILGQVYVATVGTGQVTAVYSGHTSDVLDLDIDDRQLLAASGGADGTARVWSVEDGRELFILAGGRGGVLAVDFNSSASRLLTVGAEGVALVWDITPLGGRELMTERHDAGEPSQRSNFYREEIDTPVYTAFLPGGSSVMAQPNATGFFSDTGVIDIATSVRTGFGHQPGESSVATADGGTVATAIGGWVNQYDALTGAKTAEYGERRGDIESPKIAYSADGDRLAVYSTHGLVEVFDTATQQKLEALPAGEVTSLLFDHGGRVVTTHRDGRARIWAEGTGTTTDLQVGLSIGNAAIHGNTIIASDFQGSWSAKDLDDGAEVFSLRFAHTGGINWIEISGAAPLMATAGRDGTIKLWDLEDGTELMTLGGVGPAISSLALSDDGALLAAVDDDLIRVYTLDVAKLLEIGRSRVTRSLTDAECLQYLHTATCSS